MPKTSHRFDQLGLSVHPCLDRAVSATLSSWLPEFKGLPMPVRFRATGALSAWQRMADELPGGRAARTLLQDADMPVSVAIREAVAALLPHFGACPPPLQGMIEALLATAGSHLIFWWRGGALYEPTQALGTLLGATDWSQELPLQCLAPAVPALCIVPPWQQRHVCAGAHAIYVYQHAAPPVLAPAQRCLTIEVQQPAAEGGVEGWRIPLAYTDEHTTINDAIAQAKERTRVEIGRDQLSDEALLEQQQRWHRVLDYVVKVLLYLRLDSALVRELRPYSSAARDFAGLGRKKREARLAEIEKLYDRYVVGPVQLNEFGADGRSNTLPTGSELSAHWRRGHFRLQPYGPQASLRKVLFIAPTLVRADRLATVELQ